MGNWVDKATIHIFFVSKMKTINDTLHPPVDHSCLHCNKRFVQRRNPLRHIKCQHPLNVADKKLECQLTFADVPTFSNAYLYHNVP